MDRRPSDARPAANESRSYGKVKMCVCVGVSVCVGAVAILAQGKPGGTELQFAGAICGSAPNGGGLATFAAILGQRAWPPTSVAGAKPFRILRRGALPFPTTILVHAMSKRGKGLEGKSRAPTYKKRGRSLFPQPPVVRHWLSYHSYLASSTERVTHRG